MILIIETTDNINVTLTFYSDIHLKEFLCGHPIGTTYTNIVLYKNPFDGMLSVMYSDHNFIVTKMKTVVIKLKKKNG